MTIPRPFKIKRDDAIIILILILFVFLFRLATLMIMNTGIDESDYWMAAKNLRLGPKYVNIVFAFFEINHAVFRSAGSCFSLTFFPGFNRTSPFDSQVLAGLLPHRRGFRARAFSIV